VPVGVPGELYIGGDCLAQGYLNRPDLTAERFIQIPDENTAAQSASEPSSRRLYRTGDRARWLPDGSIEYLGRLDQQVKIRGFRVEPGEIEVVLNQHPAVRETAVAVRDQRLAAYVVARAAVLPGDELRQFLKERLPDYMIPSAFVSLEALPLTPSGKLDRNALPTPSRARSTRADYVPPRTPVEEALAHVWAEVLEVEPLGVHDDFFELGGHSLLATQIASRIRDLFQIDLPLRTLFDAPTIAGIGAKIEQTLHRDQRLIPPPIRPADRRRPPPLSFSQERMWFVQQLDPASAAYNVPNVVRLHGPLNVEALRHSLDELARRHESLRTTFAVVDGQVAQMIHAPASVPITLVDLRDTPEREHRAVEMASDEAGRPFDLERGPLFRAQLLRLDETAHILGLYLHHTVTDAWSLRVLLHELTTVYNAAVAGQPTRLPDLPVQYADYAAWQREWLQGEVLEAHMTYWRGKLSGLAALQLPTDRHRPPKQSYHGAYQSLDLPEPLLAAIRRLSSAEGATPFMALLAAFMTLLYRYSGQEDIAVGVPIANRNWLASEDLIGCLVNTLVMRADLTAGPTFRVLLRRVRDVALEAYAHQDMPFAQLVAELQPERDLSRSPLVQVMFNLLNVPRLTPELTHLHLEPVELDRGAAQFDLTMTILDLPLIRRVAIEYNTDLFEPATIRRMLGHFITLLEGLLADPERCLGDLPLLTHAERRQIFSDWNHTRTDHPWVGGLHHGFEAQARRTPETVIVIDALTQLNYSDLNRRANQLAHYLRRLGVGRGTLVGICIERSAAMVVGLLGILKAGAVYVPLDPSYPKERLLLMLRDSGAPIVVTQTAVWREVHIADEGLQVVDLESDWPAVSRSPSDNPDSPTDPDDLAYVIYTSGSTGTPKGVQAPHRGALNRLQWMWTAYPFEAGEVCCQKTAVSFVDSVWEIFGPLLKGVPLVIIPDEVVRDPARLVSQLAERCVTRLVLVPSLLKAILDVHDDLGARLPRLKWWISSGEALSHDLCRRFHSQMPHARLLNLYGSSEAAGDSLYYEPQPDDTRSLAPIGRPIANTQVYLLDAHLQPVPVGVPGEICIGGDGLARGYLHQPGLTAERFVEIADEGSETMRSLRVYRTGDLGAYRPDGVIEYQGRRDDQVKLRGFRVEPGEIEATLRQHPGVREAVIVARHEPNGEKQLAAYCVPHPGRPLDAHGLRDFLKDKLPAFMLPSAFVVLEALPLTPNGKVDRRALPVPEARPPQTGYVAPRDMLEAKLARVWGEVLQVNHVGVTDDFFALGGHSLLAVRLFVEIEAMLGRRLPVATLFESPTIESLASCLTRDGWSPPWSSLIAIQTSGARPPFYCVHEFDGQAFYYRDLALRLGPDQPFYGLQAQGLDGVSSIHTTLEEMAAHYVAEVRRFQAHGPYYLGGSSLGGLVAFEMAQQLHRQGQPVAVLAMFDTWCPGYFRLTALPARYRLARHADAFGRSGLRHLLKVITPMLNVGQWLDARREGWVRWRSHRQAQALMRGGRPLPPDLRDRHMRATLTAAAARYMPRPYPGKVTFFQARERPARYYHDPRLSHAMLIESGFVSRRDADAVWRSVHSLSWEALAGGGLEVQETSGPHGFMAREPHAAALAQALRRCLDGTDSHGTD
jgi:amino acid adenylation domain-containing protein